MNNPLQEFDASGIPSLRPYSNYLLQHGAAEHVKVKWGKGERYVIIVEGKNIYIKANTTLIRI